MQDLAFGLVKLHEVHTGPHLKPLKDPQDDVLSLQCVDHTTQLGVMGTPAEGALSPTVHVIDRDIKQHQSQY